MSNFYRQRGVTLLLLLFAFRLRILDLGARSLWFDEAVETLTAAVPWWMLPEAIITGNYQPPLNIYLLHLWQQVTMHPFWLRYLFVLISLFSVLGMMELTRLLVGDRGRAGQGAVLVAGLLTALLPTENYYAQDVGEYALLVCLLTWLAVFLVKIVRQGADPRLSLLISWVITAAAAVYTHYGAIILVLPGALLLLFRYLRRGAWTAVRNLLLLLAAATLTGLPLLLYFLPSQIRRVSSSVLNKPIFTSPLEELRLFFSGLEQVFSFHLLGYPFSGLEPSLWSLLLLLLLAAGLLLLWRRAPQGDFWALWILTAYLFYFLLVRIGLYVGFGSRYGLIFLPFYVTAAAALFAYGERSRWRWFSRAVLLLLLGVQLYALPQPSMTMLLRDRPSWAPTEMMGELFAYWQQRRAPQEPTYVYYGAVPAFRYYLLAAGLDPDPVTETNPFAVCDTVTAGTVCREQKVYFSPWVRHLSPEEKLASFTEVMGELPARVWVLISHSNPAERDELLGQLTIHYEIADQFGRDAEMIYLLVRRLSPE